jgi:hypothetical protein
MATGWFLNSGSQLDAGLYFDGTYPSPGVGEYTGSGLYLVFDTIALRADYRKFSVDENIGLKDCAGGQDAARVYLTELTGGKATYEGLYQTEDAAISGIETLAKTKPGAYGLLTWCPEGPVTGTPQYSVDVVIKNRKIDKIYDDVIKIAIEFEFDGTVTPSVVA